VVLFFQFFILSIKILKLEKKTTLLVLRVMVFVCFGVCFDVCLDVWILDVKDIDILDIYILMDNYSLLIFLYNVNVVYDYIVEFL